MSAIAGNVKNVIDNIHCFDKNLLLEMAGLLEKQTIKISKFNENIKRDHKSEMLDLFCKLDDKGKDLMLSLAEIMVDENQMKLFRTELKKISIA